MGKKTNLEEKLSDVIRDKSHGSSHLVRKLASNMKELMEVWESEKTVAEGLRRTLELLRHYHPDLLVLQSMIKELLATHECSSGLSVKELDLVLDRFLEREKTTTDLLGQFLSERKEKQLFTLSHSSTVLKGLERAYSSLKTKPTIAVLESIPGNEGLVMARELKAAGFSVIVVADTAINVIDFSKSIGIVGFDQIDDRFLLNKIGTKSLALAFEWQKRPMVVVGSTNKVVEKINFNQYRVDASQLHFANSGDHPCYWPSDARFPRFAPIFEPVELSLFDKIITDCGIYSILDWSRCYHEVLKRRELRNSR